MDKESAEYTDLDTVHEMVALLQKDKGVNFGNDRQWGELFERRNSILAFSIAFEAVYRETISGNTAMFIQGAIQGMLFWMRQCELRRAGGDHG